MKAHEKLREYISNEGMKRNFVAVTADMKVSRFYKILDGSAKFTADELIKMCKQGAVPLEIFFGDKFSITEKVPPE